MLSAIVAIFIIAYAAIALATLVLLRRNLTTRTVAVAGLLAGLGFLTRYAGAGLVARTGSFGVFSLAASGSRHGGDKGLQAFAAYETKFLGLSLNVSTQRTFGGYDDLASVTAPPVTAVNALILPIQTSVRPPA